MSSLAPPGRNLPRAPLLAPRLAHAVYGADAETMASFFRENGPSPLVPGSGSGSGRPGWSPAWPPAVSDEQVIGALLACGARLVASQPHGTMLSRERRLIFVRRTRWLTPQELEDTARLARLAPEHLERLLARSP